HEARLGIRPFARAFARQLKGHASCDHSDSTAAVLLPVTGTVECDRYPDGGSVGITPVFAASMLSRHDRDCPARRAHSTSMNQPAPARVKLSNIESTASVTSTSGVQAYTTER